MNEQVKNRNKKWATFIRASEQPSLLSSNSKQPNSPLFSLIFIVLSKPSTVIPNFLLLMSTDITTTTTTRVLRHSPAHWASPSKPKQSPRKPNTQLIEKCYSEPILFPGDDDAASVGDSRSFDSGETGYLTRFHTYDDVLSCTPQLIHSPLSRFNSGYDKDAKVVITVSVEGSPGPIRTLVKLGTSVEDTISLVVRKYVEEGRTPRLDKDSFSFDLHVSYFSLQCLDRSDAIGDAGSRSFYLRKNDRKSNEVGTITLTSSDGILQNDDVQRGMNSPSKQLRPQMSGFHPFFARKMNKIERRFLRLFKVLGCLDSK